MSFQRNRKGFSTIILGLIVVLTVFLVTLVYINTYRYAFYIRMTEFYELDRLSDITRVVLMSTYNDKPLSSLLGEFISLGNSPDASDDVKEAPNILKERIEMIIGKGACYKLFIDTLEIKSDLWDSDCSIGVAKSFIHVDRARIATPNPADNSVKEIKLVKKTIVERRGPAERSIPGDDI